MVKKKKASKTKKKAAPVRRTKAKQARARVKLSAKKKAKPAAKRPRGKAESAELLEYRRRGLSTGGQSGDTQGIPARLRADSESVEELLEEGQTFEAEAIAGVESAPDPDESEVVTHESPEDDVPEEYRERDE